MPIAPASHRALFAGQPPCAWWIPAAAPGLTAVWIKMYPFKMELDSVSTHSQIQGSKMRTWRHGGKGALCPESNFGMLFVPWGLWCHRSRCSVLRFLWEAQYFTLWCCLWILLVLRMERAKLAANADSKPSPKDLYKPKGTPFRNVSDRSLDLHNRE